MSQDTQPLAWEQLPQEPQDLYNKFCEFARPLGSDYTTRRAYIIYRHELEAKGIVDIDTFGLWALYATQYAWEERAYAWFEDSQKMYEALFLKRRLELADSDWETGKELRDFAHRSLRLMTLSETTGRDENGNNLMRVSVKPGELAGLVRAATELQRLSVGEPTIINGIGESGVAIYLPSNERKEQNG